jgi:hypothetical protein
MKPTERAYLAGLIDGEAYVGVTRAISNSNAKQCKRGVCYRVMIVVSMTDRSPLDYARRVSGLGQVNSRKVGYLRKPAWVWTVWSRQAATLLKQLAPYLIVKARPARACIEFQALMRYPGRNGLTDYEWRERQRLWKRTKVNP